MADCVFQYRPGHHRTLLSPSLLLGPSRPPWSSCSPHAIYIFHIHPAFFFCFFFLEWVCWVKKIMVFHWRDLCPFFFFTTTQQVSTNAKKKREDWSQPLLTMRSKKKAHKHTPAHSTLFTQLKQKTGCYPPLPHVIFVFYCFLLCFLHHLRWEWQSPLS